MFSVLPTASCLAIGAPEARNGSSCSPLRAPRHLGAYMGPVVVLQYADKKRGLCLEARGDIARMGSA